jgi:peptidoglycan/LPS O-acetylase OafA/YrhL
MHRAAPEINRYFILDLLRLLAALSVMCYHYSIYRDVKTGEGILQNFDLGYLGVNFFFMLSGFVIIASADNRSAFNFLIARAQRLYPAFIVCLSLTLLIIWFTSSQLVSFSQALLNATLLNDYLGVPNVDGVYWTLQAELKFYICVYALLLFGMLDYWRYWLSLWCASAILFHYVKQPFFMGWFINPGYSFYFIGGVCAYLLSKNPGNKSLLGLFIISMIFSVIKTGLQINDFVPQANAQLVLEAQLFVGLFFVFFYCLAKGYLNIKHVPAWWIYLGSISYPLYLLHNRAGKALIGYFNNAYGISLTVLAVSFAILSLSLAVHLLIEKPFNKWVRKIK